MKTKKIAKPEEWFKEFTPENVEVVLCGTSGDTTDSNQSGGTENNDGELNTSSLDNNKSTGIYENSFSYNPFE